MRCGGDGRRDQAAQGSAVGGFGRFSGRWAASSPAVQTQVLAILPKWGGAICLHEKQCIADCLAPVNLPLFASAKRAKFIQLKASEILSKICSGVFVQTKGAGASLWWSI